jgi:hypothetical protein
VVPFVRSFYFTKRAFFDCKSIVVGKIKGVCHNDICLGTLTIMGGKEDVCLSCLSSYSPSPLLLSHLSSPISGGTSNFIFIFVVFL